MDGIATRRALEEVARDFDRLLAHLTALLAEIRPRTKIASTKLAKIRKDLRDLEGLDKQSLVALAEIVLKYNAINHLFEGGLIFNKQDVAKIVEGKPGYQTDSQEAYNDCFFELSMGVRFWRALQKTKPHVKVALDGICDVIIDDTIAIECKYIHSAGNLVHNVRTARDQINTRISTGLAQYGFIALDLSTLGVKRRVQDFANYAFAMCLENYRTLQARGRIQSLLASEIVHDNNFREIVSKYTMLEAETALMAELGFSFELGENVRAIIFQKLNTFVFEYDADVALVSTRGLSYLLNPELDEEQARETKQFIHRLAVGV